MKTFIVLTLLSLSIPLTQAATSQVNLGSISTVSGRSFQDCRILKTDPDGIFIAHRKGTAKLLFAELPDLVRAKCGYDAAKAGAYTVELAARRSKEREHQTELRRQMLKAQAFASAMNGAQPVAIPVSGGYPTSNPDVLGWSDSLPYIGWSAWSGGWNGWDTRGAHFSNRCTTLRSSAFTGCVPLNNYRVVRQTSINNCVPYARTANGLISNQAFNRQTGFFHVPAIGINVPVTGSRSFSPAVASHR